MRDEVLTPMEQLREVWKRYVNVLLLAGMTISPSQASELRDLAEELVWLHEQEAAECRQRAKFWRGYVPPARHA